MNERIKLLDKQAYQWAINESKGGPNICAPGSDYFLAMEKKKFAELIVRECSELTLDHKGDDYYNGWLDYRDEIKRHFGVEE